MKIVVIGGTGLIGSRVVQNFASRGMKPSRPRPAPASTPSPARGWPTRSKGAAVVIDVTNAPSWRTRRCSTFFETSTRNILAQEAAAGTGHHVALSVVGTDRLLESGYFRAKIAQENLIKSSSLPYSIVHATQFYEFVKAIADAPPTATIRLASAMIQPMAADDVATPWLASPRGHR